MHTTEHDELCGLLCTDLRELQAVTIKVRESNNLVLLVVVAEDDDLGAELTLAARDGDRHLVIGHAVVSRWKRRLEYHAVSPAAIGGIWMRCKSLTDTRQRHPQSSVPSLRMLSIARSLPYLTPNARIPVAWSCSHSDGTGSSCPALARHSWSIYPTAFRRSCGQHYHHVPFHLCSAAWDLACHTGGSAHHLGFWNDPYVWVCTSCHPLGEHCHTIEFLTFMPAYLAQLFPIAGGQFIRLHPAPRCIPPSLYLARIANALPGPENPFGISRFSFLAGAV